MVHDDDYDNYTGEQFLDERGLRRHLVTAAHRDRRRGPYELTEEEYSDRVAVSWRAVDSTHVHIFLPTG